MASGACAFNEGSVDGAPPYLSDVIAEVFDEYPMLAEILPAGLALILFHQTRSMFRRRGQGNSKFAAIPTSQKKALDLEEEMRSEATLLASAAAGEVEESRPEATPLASAAADKVEQVEEAPGEEGGPRTGRRGRGSQRTRKCRGARHKEAPKIALDLGGETRPEAVLPAHAATGELEQAPDQECRTTSGRGGGGKGQDQKFQVLPVGQVSAQSLASVETGHMKKAGSVPKARPKYAKMQAPPGVYDQIPYDHFTGGYAGIQAMADVHGFAAQMHLPPPPGLSFAPPPGLHVPPPPGHFRPPPGLGLFQ